VPLRAGARLREFYAEPGAEAPGQRTAPPETRRVDHAGYIKWKNRRIFLTHTLQHEFVGFEEFEDSMWSLFYGPVMLARFDARAARFFT